jgi:hypothetical protein
MPREFTKLDMPRGRVMVIGFAVPSAVAEFVMQGGCEGWHAKGVFAKADMCRGYTTVDNSQELVTK